MHPYYFHQGQAQQQQTTASTVYVMSPTFSQPMMSMPPTISQPMYGQIPQQYQTYQGPYGIVDPNSLIQAPAIKCYGYVRVSSDRQADNGLSLGNQTQSIIETATRKRYQLLKIFVDKAVSGRKTKGRPGLAELLSTIQKGDVIISYTMARLSRGARDFFNIYEEINAKGATLELVKENIDTTTASGIFMLNVYASMAQLESDTAKQRVKEILDRKRMNNEFIGRPPYGWKLSGGSGSDPEEVEDEQIIIRQIKKLSQQCKPNGKKTQHMRLQKSSMPNASLHLITRRNGTTRPSSVF
jgi:site-specific DNA recombinase